MSAEDFEGLKELAKKNHDERVAKTPERIKYATSLFIKNGIEYKIKNNTNGHFHLMANDGSLVQFWCSTGKIWYDHKVEKKHGLKRSVRNWRGIDNAVKLLNILNKTDNEPTLDDVLKEFDIEGGIRGLQLRLRYYEETIASQKFNYDNLHKFKNELQDENKKLKNELRPKE